MAAKMIKACFTEEEFAEFSEYEKLRLRNIKENYEMMIKVGLDVPLPEFMRRPSGRKRNMASHDHNDKEPRLPGEGEAWKRASSFKVPIKQKQTVSMKKNATIYKELQSDAECAAVATSNTSYHELDRNDKEAEFSDVLPNDTDGDDLVCKFCNQAFIGKLSLLEHLKNHHHQSPLNKSCKLFSNQLSRVQPSTVPSIIAMDAANKCGICGLRLSSCGALSNHSRTHTGEKPYKCKLCGECFARNGNLERHERTHTGDEAFQCNSCCKRFSIKGNLKRHERTHTGVKPYQCTHCNMSFADSSNLNTHERTHTGIKPLKCTQCYKAFALRHQLTNHLGTHTGIKLYKCTYCNKSFSDRSNLNRHTRIHTRIKPYKCTHCNKSFAQSGDLNRHVRTHTGIKPYKCK